MQRITPTGLCFILLLLAGCGLPSLNAAIDADDVTPAIITNAPLTALWYGPLSITRYDSQTQQAATPVIDAFYLDLQLRSDNTITGTYTTCPRDTPVAAADIQTYDIAHGTFDQQRHTVYLTMFANTYSSLSGNSMTLNGQKWAPHGDVLEATYAAQLDKVPRNNFLTACHIVLATPVATPT